VAIENLEDEFDRSLGEQIRDQILREYELNERNHVLEQKYTSNVSHQDGNLPYRMQITYQNGGPSYHINDYFPHLHYQTGATLANEDYNQLIEWGSHESKTLEDLKTESEALEKLKQGAVDNISELELDEST
jgi:hypothetical protein